MRGLDYLLLKLFPSRCSVYKKSCSSLQWPHTYYIMQAVHCMYVAHTECAVIFVVTEYCFVICICVIGSDLFVVIKAKQAYFSNKAICDQACEKKTFFFGCIFWDIILQKS